MILGYIGLGKMGINMAVRLKEHGHEIIAYNRSEEPRKEAEKQGVKTVASIPDLLAALPKQKILWVMVSHAAVDTIIEELLPSLSPGDLIIDGGNSNFKDSVRRGAMLQEKKVLFLDAGVSGGPGGAKSGACVMIGGEAEAFRIAEPLFKDIAAPNAYMHLGAVGSGHFAKMVHNGIEYGMMQALAEGFHVLKESPFGFDLSKLARLYNTRSVIESRLVGWLEEAYTEFGENLDCISGTVAHTGEGEWTVWSAKELGVPVPVIEASLEFRKKSEKEPDYTGQVLSALRNRFGGHSTSK